MQKNIKNNIITYGFVFILITMFAINIFSKDKEISISERRKLTTFPEITIENLLSGDVSNKLEKYTTDQVAFRDNFRSIKAFCDMNIFMKKDSNGLFLKNDSIYKMEYPLNKANVFNSFNKINNVYNRYLKNMNVYYAIIPDKNYYLTDDDHLKFDYASVRNIAQSMLNNMQYIDVWNVLNLDDYYKTDLHWKQESLVKVANVLEKNMKLEKTSINEYTIRNIGEFYGTYYSQLSANVLPDNMYILTNDILDNSVTYNYEKNKFGKIYDDNNTFDKYDVYLSGATPLIRIDNPNSSNQRELLIFRDSFGSSIAPLLVKNYSRVTLIDLRYISADLLEKYIEFDNQDVLFIYSTLILNQNVLK